MRITGTFLDEITFDIPSANWGPAEWAADFDAMQAVGIDTVILIRSGFKDRMTFESRVLPKFQPMRPAYLDLVDLFLTQAERCGMTFYFGTYDSYHHWHTDPELEVRINMELADEVMARYGHRQAFGGWYITQEAVAFDERLMVIYEKLARHLKALKNVPTLISPLMLKEVTPAAAHPNPEMLAPDALAGVGGFNDLAGYERNWDAAFHRFSQYIDAVAFQDGYVTMTELPEYLEIDRRLARKHGIESWSNVESFERGMPLNFLPIDWRNLRYKIEAATTAGCDKLITFEFSHFMSPNSMWPSARNLYNRYKEWIVARASRP